MRPSSPALRAALGLALLLSASVLRGQRLPPATVAEIETAISAEMSRLQIPGLSVAVATEGEVRWSQGYGLADLENFVPAKSATAYRLGSVSKPITATAIMQLAETGRLDLDAPIRNYVPAFPEKAWPVTTRQLLAHLGGVRHYAEGEFASTRHYASLEEGLAIFKDDPLLHEPGTKFHYTTYGYNLLGTAVEAASGMSFRDYLRANVFKPAGMERTGPDDVFALIPNRAQGYARDPAGELRNSGLTDTSYKIPGGGLISTAPDVARFAVAFQSGALVQKETVSRMLTRQKTRDGKATGYGLGWFLGERDGRREAWHTGGQQRVSTVLYMQPDRRLAVAILTNLEGIGAPLVDLARRMAGILK